MINLDPYRACRLCPRACGVDRIAGRTGHCGETATLRLAHWGPHFGEEPPLSGTRGSGTLFFTGCSCRCFFCQNHQISMEGEGRPCSPEQFLAAALDLIDQGVHNLNFVTPDHFWPHIRGVVGALRAAGATLPMVMNGSGYHDPGVVNEMADHAEIFLPDFKFADPDLAQACMGDARYPALALAAIGRMVERVGFMHPWDPSGRDVARQGVLIRHLILPGHVDNSREVLRLIRREFGRLIPLSLMRQYRPTPRCQDRGMFARPVTPEEARRVLDEAMDLGFEQVFAQLEGGDVAFLPDFTQNRPFQGNPGGAP